MTPHIEQIVAETLSSLQTLPATILYQGITTTEFEAMARADELARAGVDAVIMHFVTFPSGAIIPAIAQRLNVPFLLVSNPERPGLGKVLRQNSFCGSNMAAHGLSFVEQRVDVPEIPSWQIWCHIYDSIVQGVPFPVTLEQGAEVVRVMQVALENSGFKPEHCFWRQKNESAQP